MATFSDLKTRVQQLLKRSTFFDPTSQDVTQAALGQFVNFAHTTIQRFIPVKQAIEQTQIISIGPGNHPYQTTSLTFSFRYEYDLWASSAGAGVTPMRPLRRYQNIRQFHNDFPPTTIGIGGVVTSSAPMGWVMYGVPMAITLGPPPDVTYTFSLDYVMWLPQLVNAGDTSWYTLNADDALTYLACKEAATWLQEDQLIQLYDKMAQDKIKDVLRTFREEESSEGDLVAQLLG